MNDIIYIKNGEIVEENTPNAVAYVKMTRMSRNKLEDKYTSAIKMQEHYKNEADSLRLINDKLSEQNDDLRTRVELQKKIIDQLEHRGQSGHAYHDEQSVFKGE